MCILCTPQNLGILSGKRRSFNNTFLTKAVNQADEQSEAHLSDFCEDLTEERHDSRCYLDVALHPEKLHQAKKQQKKTTHQYKLIKYYCSQTISQTDNSTEIIAKQNKYYIKTIKAHGAFLQNCTSEAAMKLYLPDLWAWGHMFGPLRVKQPSFKVGHLWNSHQTFHVVKIPVYPGKHPGVWPHPNRKFKRSPWIGGWGLLTHTW